MNVICSTDGNMKSAYCILGGHLKRRSKLEDRSVDGKII
jgi:hypothetical protein